MEYRGMRQCSDALAEEFWRQSMHFGRCLFLQCADACDAVGMGQYTDVGRVCCLSVFMRRVFRFGRCLGSYCLRTTCYTLGASDRYGCVLWVREGMAWASTDWSAVCGALGMVVVLFAIPAARNMFMGQARLGGGWRKVVIHAIIHHSSPYRHSWLLPSLVMTLRCRSHAIACHVPF